MLTKITAFYEYLEKSEITYEHKIAELVNQYWSENGNGEEPPIELKWESLAFLFQELATAEVGNACYQPMWTGKNEAGQLVEFPSRSEVTPEIIEYWTQRSKNSINPVLKYRYSNLLIDFSEEVLGNKAPNEIYTICSDCLLNVLSNHIQPDYTHVYAKANRLIQLATTRNQLHYKDECLRILFEMTGIRPGKPITNLVAICYDLFIANQPRKILTDTEISLIINDLKSKLTESIKLDLPRQAEYYSDKLFQYYISNNEKDAVKIILDQIFGAYRTGFERLPVIQKSVILEDFYQKYKLAGFKSEADKLIIELRKLGSETAANLKKFQIEESIPTEAINQHIEVVVSGDWPRRFNNLIQYFLPDKEEISKRLDNIRKEAPFQYLIRMQIIDYQGRVVTTLDPYQDDPDGHRIFHLHKELQIDQIFLLPVMDKLLSFGEEFEKNFMDYISASPAFEKHKFPIIQEALKAFIDKNFLIAIHLLIPQIEAAIRTLIELGGGIILRQKQKGEFDIATLGDLLRDPIIANIYDDNIQFYLKAMLVDKRGWNLRNLVSHGITNPQFFSYNAAARLLHIVLLLGVVRINDHKDN